MKKLKWLILVMCLVLGLSVFAACGGNNDDNTNTTVEATKITLASTINVEVGKSNTLTAIITPETANAEITWTSSDTTVATVKATSMVEGVALASVTGVKAGTATVTATISGKSATCEVTVKEHEEPAFDIRIKGNYNSWGVTSLCAANLNEEDGLTATFQIKYEGDDSDFGLFSAKKGDTEQVAWARDDVTLNLDEVDGIINGGSNWVISEGVYEFTATIDIKGKFTALTVKSDVTESEDAIQIPPPPPAEYNIKFHGGWDGGDWCDIAFGEMVYDATHLTYTADVVLKEGDFGVRPVVAGTTTQAGWANSDVMELGDGVTTITLTAGQNAKCTAAGTYNVTITMNEKFEVAKVTFNSFTAAE